MVIGFGTIFFWHVSPVQQFFRRIMMKWVTRSQVRVDRVACPWLITRFIDSEAEFLFVPKNQVVQTAATMGAIPFDVPGVELSHHNGGCSFEALLRKYDLTDPALQRMALAVRCADSTGDTSGDPIAAGLEAIAIGYSLRYPSDEESITAQFEVYDSLYAWCRLQATVQGNGNGHH
jgi:hypothetical protein